MSTAQLEIPPGIEAQASTTITAMTQRGLREPCKLTALCRTVASVTLAKADIIDKRMVRCLTNRLICKAHDVSGV